MSDKIHDPARVREAQQRRVQLAAEQRLAREKKLREQAQHRVEQDRRQERQKEATAHYFKTDDGKRQMRGAAVSGEKASRPDGKLVSHGFNAESMGPAEKDYLNETQRKQRDFQLQHQQKERQRAEKARAERHREKATRGFNRSAGKDGRDGR